MKTAAYKFYTKPFDHQKKCWELSRDRDFFAVFMEQGTGKSKVLVDTAGYLYENDKIDTLVVVGPSEGDVPLNWIEQEIPNHLPPRIKRLASRLYSGHWGKGKTAILKALLEAPRSIGMRIIATNIEAIRKGSDVFDYLLNLCRKHRVMMVIDESTRIKSHSAAQTKAAYKLGANASYRRLASGLPDPNGPLDMYSQFEFMQPGSSGFDSFTAFKAHFCQLLPPEHGIVRYTAQKMAGPKGSEEYKKKLQSIIQIPMRDAQGQMIYKNQSELAAKIALHSFRVLKDDCLDLPPKLYVKRYVELTSQQRTIYDEVRKRVIAEFVHDGELHNISIQLQITRLLRLQQVICNHFSPDPDPDEPKSPPKRIEEIAFGKKGAMIIGNPRMLDLLDWIDLASRKAKGIIWCRHHPEIREIVEVLSAKFGSNKVVQLHGKIKGDLRVEARKRFQDKKDPAQWLVGQIRSGIGIDLYEASWEYFYSNSYSLEDRLQAEDRGHRQGLKHPLTIVDCIAKHTLDERMVTTLRSKKDISDMILGDSPKNWL